MTESRRREVRKAAYREDENRDAEYDLIAYRQHMVAAGRPQFASAAPARPMAYTNGLYDRHAHG